MFGLIVGQFEHNHYQNIEPAGRQLMTHRACRPSTYWGHVNAWMTEIPGGRFHY